MNLSYNWLQEYFKEKLPKPEKLAEFLTMHSFEVEDIKKSGKDYIFNIDILPNRMPDCSGHNGVAKEISAVLNIKLKIKNSKISNSQFLIFNKIPKSKFPISKNLEIKVEDKDLCPRYTAQAMRNVKVGPSPKWLKERLEALGLNSINNIVDAANYIMLETGQPIHIFDLDKIENMEIPNSKFQIPNKPQMSKSKIQKKQIIVRRAKNGEKITTLDGRKYDLDENILVIADLKGPLAIAGIKGGKRAEVDAKTKNIIIEAANFNQSSIRQTSQKLDLQTDASKRFSYNIDSNLAVEANVRLAAFIQELAGGEIDGLTDIYPKKVVSARIKLDFDKVRKVLGVNITDKEIKDILKRLNFKLQTTSAAANKLQTVIIPTIRRDITIEEDLIEEIGRIYGYDKIRPLHPAGELIPPKQIDTLIISKIIKNFLVGQGFSEIYSYSFIGERDLEILETSARKNIVELQNPLSSELKFLRPSLLFNILKTASFNFKNYDGFRLFEFGKVFGDNISEKMNFAGILADKGAGGQKLFYRLKGVLSSLFETLGIDDAWFDDFVGSVSNTFLQTAFKPSSEKNINGKVSNGIERSEMSSLALSFSEPRRISQIKIGDEIAGILGEVRPDILAHYDIKKGNVIFFEIDFGILAEKTEEEREFRPFSKFPSIIRDLSLLVPNETRIAEVENIIETQGGGLLVDTDLFDIYEDEKFRRRKSLAFRLVFQSDERTLSDAEVDDIMKKIIIALEQNPAWEVRK